MINWKELDEAMEYAGEPVLATDGTEIYTGHLFSTTPNSSDPPEEHIWMLDYGDEPNQYIYVKAFVPYEEYIQLIAKFQDSPSLFENTDQMLEKFQEHDVTLLKVGLISSLTKKAIELLEKYEAWEAGIIGDNECWAPEGMASFPRLTSKLWDEMLELQQERNKILERFKSVSP